MAQPDHDGAVVYLVIREEDEYCQVLHAFTTRAEADRYVRMARAAIRGESFARVAREASEVIPSGPDNAEAEEDDREWLRVRSLPLRTVAKPSLVQRQVRVSMTTHTHEQHVREDLHVFATLGEEWAPPTVSWRQQRYGDFLLGPVTSATLSVCDWTRPEEPEAARVTRVQTFMRQAWAWAHAWAALDGWDDDRINAALTATMREREEY